MGKLGNRYQIWAMDNGLETPEKNVPDVVLRGLWKRMVAEGRDKAFFWGGSVTDDEKWLQYIKSFHNLPVFVLDTEIADICMFAILNGIKGKVAQGHFCGIGQYRRGIGEAVLDFWAGIKGSDGAPMLDLVWGTTPVVSVSALRLIKILGFTVLGQMPHLCHIEELNESVPGVISYLDLKEYRNGTRQNP